MAEKFDRTPSDATSPATVRGDVEKGTSGDKKPGFDPAAAPMETDAEASAAPPSPQEAAVDRRAQAHPDRSDHQGTTADAMRPFEPGRKREIKGRGKAMLAIALGTTVIGLLFALLGD